MSAQGHLDETLGHAAGSVGPPEHEPGTSLHDPRAMQILSTGHWSLLSTRFIANNEAFRAAGLSTSFLALR